MICRYSSFVVEIFVKVALTFHGLVETYKRGDAAGEMVSRVPSATLSRHLK
jgi:hypothetical protein